MIFAIDFDGTIVEHKFPQIGREMPGAIDTLRRLKTVGHKIIIWTCRSGVELRPVFEWFEWKGFAPDAYNANIFHTNGFAVPKILADVYIDDHSFPPFPGWDVVWDEYLNVDGTPKGSVKSEFEYLLMYNK